MTLELNRVARQIKTMGHTLSNQQPARDQALLDARLLLQQYATRFTALIERVEQAEKVKQNDRFGWIGAAPTREAIADAYPLPKCPDQLTILACDGSQILPDQHAIFPYYLLNIGCIIYRHGSNQKPETYQPEPVLCYEPFDEQGRLISAGEINVQRDLAELETLVDRVRYIGPVAEPVVALLDGQLALRVIDLPFDQQQACQATYIGMLNSMRETNPLLAAYIDRPRSTYVLSLLQLAGLDVAQITEDALRAAPFHRLTDLQLFDFLGPGERSAIFTLRAKGYEIYAQHGHEIHFFYLNAGANSASPALARVEIPAWVAHNPQAVDVLQAVLVRQAQLTGGYPYVLARADELAVISSEERQAVEMMLAIEMRRLGLIPEISLKQYNKTLFRFTNVRGISH